jgi:hypothetical protein
VRRLNHQGILCLVEGAGGSDDDLPDAAAQRLDQALADSRWTVLGRITESGALSLNLSHPLSDYGYTMLPEHLDEWERRLDQFVRVDQEIGLVRQGPLEVPHGRVVRGFRAAAWNNRWTDATVGEVVAALFELDLLTTEEAEWIRLATANDRAMLSQTKRP